VTVSAEKKEWRSTKGGMMNTGQFFFPSRGKVLLLIASLSAGILAGCAHQQVWTKRGLNQNDFDRDLARCEREASSATQIVHYAYATGLEQGLDRSMARENLIKKCMRSKGYTLTNK
jgi:hypothetical protein